MATALVPHLVVHGAAKAIAFYTAALGATEVRRMPAEDGVRLMHAHLHIDGLNFFLCDEFPEHTQEDHKVQSPEALGGSPVTLHLDVPNCDEAVARFAAAGGRVVLPPWDAFWGDRYARAVDPFGHTWSFAHRLGESG